MLKKILILTAMLGSTAAFAQVAPSAVGGNAALWVGGEISSFNSDYASTSRLVGPGAFFDLNVTRKLGVEGEARWLHYKGTGGETQGDYLGGVKYRVYRFHKFSLNAKFLLGGVWIHYPFDIGNGSYFAYAPGAFVDYRLTRHLAVRGDYEYQILPSAPGLYPGESNGLHPTGFSVGVAYRILGSH
ncbi:opacity protein-like surface antigen [Silvibacterium bohemicum]|uniref:Opacity protein-like surface antigen n=1 Tax=Silvibacterium bohemicum TaxID=1577686 RepID=A0A841JQZ7_9BACT|nr:outer membrane beta-barrel protein [Silvibacterium bohemicum]MBB6142199.1 opacity protein-like surface antigen [Silvibacterium bohemicum]